MNNRSRSSESLSESLAQELEQICAAFEQSWNDGSVPELADALAQWKQATGRAELLENLLLIELKQRQTRGEQPGPDEYKSGFPDDVDAVERAFAVHTGQAPAEMQFATHSRLSPGPETANLSLTESSPDSDNSPLPKMIGRYRVEKLLGRGGFGVVYLAHDGELDRHVAIKAPYAEQVRTPEDADAYVAEGRLVARLDHPGIVPVYDAGRTEDGRCFVVSKFMSGTSLADHLNQNRLSLAESAELIAQVAEALHYAHRQGVVHRDIKPANLLLNAEGKPHLADFGLALRDRDFGSGPELAGSPAYMSPEQARGEGHLVDGRSDIFSLGVVFYELLTRKRPFRADAVAELLQQISSVDARPPRQLVDAIPRELERICLKAMARRATERYTTAADLAEDLRHFLSREDDASNSGSAPGQAVPEPRSVQIVPKGLRSFDAEDSDFFLELLSGVRDRDGLPESIRFWKTQIEKRDPEETFRVGLLYGPSGCGKSSLVKAGLLPRLAENVRPIYIEATADQTEARLRAGLRKACPELPPDISLKDAVVQLRLGQSTRASRKVVLIIDQFEQWLHARHEYADTELAAALRQCDGGNVQVLVMVRDDFWMAVSRFFRDIDIPLVERKNSAAVDLFDLLHARKVLAEFGRAYTRLPDNLGQLSGEQERFLDDSVTGLATEGKVISVRLALFSEMVKGKPWTPETLKQLGGISGVGVAFLEETFRAQNAPPAHRHHQQAARAVLRDLLPGEGTDIKGHWRSKQQLLEASGYANQPRDFSNLLQILDTELRLITPTDPEGAPATSTAGQHYYQLTHDYLVPALREWLNRKQKETRRGRAELRLAERAALWKAKPENQQLPGLRDYAAIRTLTARPKWTEQERAMMRRAGRLHGARLAAAMVLLLVASIAGVYVRKDLLARQRQQRADSLAQLILKSDIGEVPSLINRLDEEGLRPFAEPHFRDPLRLPDDAPEKLRASLATVATDAGQLEFLLRRLPLLLPAEAAAVRDAMSRQPGAVGLAQQLWASLNGKSVEDPGVLPTAAALAVLPSDDASWTKHGDLLAEALARANVVYLGQWLELLEDRRLPLLPGLAKVYGDQSEDRKESQRERATFILKRYAADQPQTLAELLISGEPAQYKTLYPLAAKAENAAQVVAAMRTVSWVGRNKLRAVPACAPWEVTSPIAWPYERALALGAPLPCHAGTARSLFRPAFAQAARGANATMTGIWRLKPKDQRPQHRFSSTSQPRGATYATQTTSPIDTRRNIAL